jgi:hypothetical protein
MDGSHFDSLVKGLTAHGSRRRALSGLLAGVVGLLEWPGQEDAEAHNLKTKCKKKSGEAKKKCLKKAKQHAAQHASETPPQSPPPCANGIKDGNETDIDCGGSCGKCATGKACQGSADCASSYCKNQVCTIPTCSDLDKNGTESDVDCGGSCPRCVNGKTCASRNDCLSARCDSNSTSGTCLACTAHTQCGPGSACLCDFPSGTCIANVVGSGPHMDCAPCIATGTVCVGTPENCGPVTCRRCFPRCGSA